MGAETRYFVKVIRTHEETVEISALTRLDAEHEAMLLPGVVAVKEVTHWAEQEGKL